jgi:hypothetical protein
MERLEMPPGVGVSRIESDGGRSVLLQRRKRREGENRAPTQARYRGRQRLRDHRRLHK